MEASAYGSLRKVVKIYEYKSHGDYVRSQVRGNRRKLRKVFAIRENIKVIAGFLTKNVIPLKFGICHGTRRGMEQKWFRELLGIDVIGTEIAQTAEQFDYTIQWDFHDVKLEWIDTVDFIYSNSFDHSYIPEVCLDRWMSCVRRTGVCIIEWTHWDVGSTRTDPFGASLNEYREMFNQKYVVADELMTNLRIRRKLRETVNFIIKHRSV